MRGNHSRLLEREEPRSRLEDALTAARAGRGQIAPATSAGLHVRLLGPLTVLKDGIALPLPTSRKVRALLAFLSVAPGAVTRSRLCELLWDVPDDPRGELRWSLSKLRGVLDDRQRRRVEAPGDAIALDLSDCLVDVTQISRAMQSGIDKLDLQSLRTLDALFVGDFAEGLELDRNPQFASWFSAQRRRLRAVHVAVLEQLVSRLADDANESLRYLERWLQLTPFNVRAHQILLSTLQRCGRVQEAEEHLATTIRLFEAEGLEWFSIRKAWKDARRRTAEPSSVVLASAPVRADAALETVGSATTGARRASICVMPFVDRTSEGGARGLADGLTDDIITRLAKLRVLFVIARGSVFALGERNVPPDEAGRLLNVDYVASGAVRRHNDRITVTVELAETKNARVVWVDDFNYKLDEVLAVLDEIGNLIVASIAGEIETAERKRAILKPPTSLDAWEAYHRGLWHMYRFKSEDNEQATHFFQMAIHQDRTFARAYAGLSFTHFQNAFLNLSAKRDEEIERAYETAGQSLIADDRDPAAHWAMGRALWLRGSQDESLVELETSLSLSPNFVLGHYTLGFVHSQSGDAQVAIDSIDYSRHLSPFDPLQFAMLATRAVALLRLGRHEEAADWAVKSAARPNAHVHILAIAANCLAAAGRYDEARAFVRSLRNTVPNYRLDDFFRAFRFAPDATAVFRQNAAHIGLEEWSGHSDAVFTPHHASEPCTPRRKNPWFERSYRR
jgi:DNA-binding SARP family transcriptional activator/TolB-like protein